MECFNCGLVGHPIRNIEDSGAKGGLNWIGLLAQGVSMEKYVACFCDILVKNMAALCYCPKNLSEAKVKKLRLIALTNEVSRQPV